MFEFFRGRKTIPKPPPPDTSARPQINPIMPVVTEEVRVPGLIVPGMVLLKPKKWVTVKGRTGIVTSIDSSGYVKVDLVTVDGYTVETIRVPVGQVSLARYLEIPESRRGNQVVAATKGYV